MSCQVVPSSALISITPPSRNVLPKKAKPNACSNEIWKSAVVLTSIGGETSWASATDPLSTPSQAWLLGSRVYRDQTLSAPAPVLLHGGALDSTSSVADEA